MAEFLTMSFMMFCIFLVILGKILNVIEERKARNQLYELANNSQELTPDQFFQLRKESLNKLNNYNSPGVYVLHNKTKDLYYVGQGKQVLNRVNSHLTGKGNGDVYADYKYGDDFTIRILPLEKSSYNTLNELERHTIELYNAFHKGYNKTKGNR